LPHRSKKHNCRHTTAALTWINVLLFLTPLMKALLSFQLDLQIILIGYIVVHTNKPFMNLWLGYLEQQVKPKITQKVEKTFLNYIEIV